MTLYFALHFHEKYLLRHDTEPEILAGV